ncbi:MAG: hypothetical protein ACYS17_08145 [Planctomycetota bacterium]
MRTSIMSILLLLGLGNKNNQVVGDAGMMYFDDICLYALMP